jgi:hypothetical protein
MMTLTLVYARCSESLAPQSRGAGRAYYGQALPVTVVPFITPFSWLPSS